MNRMINTIRRSAAIVTIAGLAALGLGQTAGAATTTTTAAAPDTVGVTPVDDSGDATLMGLAPACIYFTQYQNGSAVAGYYTNVYLDNNCGYSTRVKVIMRNGSDSGCLQMDPGLLDKKFTSHSNNGFRPYVNRLDAC
jgi:hypothetical protein